MYYIIVNPNARCGHGYRVWSKMERWLAAENADYEVRITRGQGEAREIARQLTENCMEPLVIVMVGGDGTVNEILDGLKFSGPITLGYIPAGTGNDLARGLRLPGQPKRCLNKILYPRYHKMMDYGIFSYGDRIVRHRRFLVSAGIGLDGAVCHSMLSQRVRGLLDRLHIGRLGYMLAGFRQLMKAKPTRGCLTLDGVKKEFNHIYFISAHNLPYEGGGFRLAPDADCTDGKLTLCVVSLQSKYKLIPILVGTFIGSHKKYQGMHCYACREADIRLERPLAAHTDGESCQCQDHVQIHCVEKKVRMII